MRIAIGTDDKKNHKGDVTMKKIFWILMTARLNLRC